MVSRTLLAALVTGALAPALAALALAPAAAAVPAERAVAGRDYIDAVELASFVATLDGVQSGQGASTRVHATARYRVGARHADGFVYGWWADEHGPGISPRAELMPPRATVRWEGRIVGELTADPDDDDPPRRLDCPIGFPAQRDELIAARAESGRPLVATLPVPGEIDRCGTYLPYGLWGDGHLRVRLDVAPAVLRRRHARVPLSSTRTVKAEGGTWTLRWRGEYRLRRVYSCTPPPRIGSMRRIGCIDSFLRHRV